MKPEELRALTIWQPWASAIFAGRGRKNIENRKWYTNYRGRLYIHAAQRADQLAPRSVWRLASGSTDDIRLPAGAIIGHVNLVACTTGSLIRQVSPIATLFPGKRPVSASVSKCSLTVSSSSRVSDPVGE